MQGKLTFSQEASPASHTAPQESDLERKMTATSGRKCLEQFERFNRAGLWAKTFAALLIGMEGWYSTKCRLTWKMRATRSHRIYFQLAPSTHPTDGIGFGLLPTVKKNDYGKGRELKDGKNQAESGQTFGVELRQLAHSGLLPTPTVMDTNCGDLDKIDARRAKALASKKNGNGFGATLGELGNRGLLPTPTKMDYKGARSSEALEAAGRTATNSLPDAFAQTGISSQLNPQFVAEMMGFPTDWLELPFLSTEKNQ